MLTCAIDIAVLNYQQICLKFKSIRALLEFCGVCGLRDAKKLAHADNCAQSWKQPEQGPPSPIPAFQFFSGLGKVSRKPTEKATEKSRSLRTNRHTLPGQTIRRLR